MKRVILGFALFLFLSCNSSSDKVYICENGSSTTFHVKQTCFALKKCNHKVVTESQEEALKEGKHVCHFCK